MTPSSSPRQRYWNRGAQILKDPGRADGRQAARTQGWECWGLTFLVGEQGSLPSRETPTPARCPGDGMGRQGGPGPGLLSSWKVWPADDLLGALAFTYAPLPVFLFLFCCLSFTFREHVSRSRPRTLIRTTPSPTGYLITHSLRSVVYSPISFSFFLLLLLSLGPFSLLMLITVIVLITTIMIYHSC